MSERTETVLVFIGGIGGALFLIAWGTCRAIKYHLAAWLNHIAPDGVIPVVQGESG